MPNFIDVHTEEDNIPEYVSNAHNGDTYADYIDQV